VTAEGFAALRPAVAPVLEASAKGVLRDGYAALDVPGVLDAARELLAAGPRTFSELRALLAERFPDQSDRALGYTVRTHLPLVMVPTDDRWAFPRDARFALADGWLGVPIATGAPAEDIVLRYLAAFGPATVADAQAFTGLKGLKAAFAALEERLTTVQDERGRTLYDLPDAPRPGEDVEAPARLLADFDSLVLAHADRSRVIADEHRPAIATKNLRILATFLVDGVVAGTWAIARKGKAATLTLAPFGRLPRGATAALRDEAERTLRFAEPEAATRAVEVAR
jgi:hypothetical protein